MNDVEFTIEIEELEDRIAPSAPSIFPGGLYAAGEAGLGINLATGKFPL